MSDRDAALVAEARRRRLHVAIDGPAGAGKSTIGTGLATELACPSLDTGLMYRTVTWLAARRGISTEDEPGLATLARAITFELAADEPTGLMVDGIVTTLELRSAGVDAGVSLVSRHSAVRTVLIARQREMAQGTCIVMIGRDIGTVVLPDAQIKLWVTATPVTRAGRRRAERLNGDAGASLQEIVGQIEARDHVDAHRPISPLKPASDAIVLHTDGKTAAISIGEAVNVVRTALRR